MEKETLIVSVLSIIISTITSLLIFFLSKKISSKNYLIKENIVSDLLCLEGVLNSICVKGSVEYYFSNIDIRKEIEFINSFLSSPTMSYILAFDKDENNHLFYYNLLIIIDSSNNAAVASVPAKKALETLHNLCVSDTVIRMKKFNITDCLNIITNEKTQINQLIKTSKDSISSFSEKRDDIVRRKFEHIKSKGISDPFIDLFLVLLNKEDIEFDVVKEIIEECKNKYGRLNVTVEELFDKYSNELTDFINT